jgi:hypothetical protein
MLEGDCQGRGRFLFFLPSKKAFGVDLCYVTQKKPMS